MYKKLTNICTIMLILDHFYASAMPESKLETTSHPKKLSIQPLEFPARSHSQLHLFSPISTSRGLLERKGTIINALSSDTDDSSIEATLSQISSIANRDILEKIRAIGAPNERKEILRNYIDRLCKLEKHYRVLSLDGGGIKGISSCMILNQMEISPLKENFDILTGTSIGAIIIVASLLEDKEHNQLYSPNEIALIIEQNAANIFEKISFPWLMQLFKPLYTGRKLHALLQAIIYGEGFLEKAKKLKINCSQIKSGNCITHLKHIKETCKTRVIIPTYDLSHRQILLLDSDEIDASLVDVCMATSAAPSYFPTYGFADLTTGTQHNCIDGGVFLNSPSLAAIGAINKSIANSHFYNSANLLLISIAPGTSLKKTIGSQQRHWGIKGWLEHGIVDLFMSGVTQFTHVFAEESIKQYERFSAPLIRASGKMDNIKPSNIRNLIDDTNEYIRSNTSKIYAVRALLFNYRTIIQNEQIDMPVHPRHFDLSEEHSHSRTSIVGIARSETAPIASCRIETESDNPISILQEESRISRNLSRDRLSRTIAVARSEASPTVFRRTETAPHNPTPVLQEGRRTSRSLKRTTQPQQRSSARKSVPSSTITKKNTK